MSRYPITAYALSNAIGANTHAVCDALRAGRSGLTENRDFELPHPTFVGAVDDRALRPLPAGWSRHDTRQARVALSVFDEIAPDVQRAIDTWGAERVALVLGSSTGGIGRTERVMATLVETGERTEDYDAMRQHAFSAVNEMLVALTGIKGPSYLVSTACTSSAKVLGSARRLLDTGIADAVLVGGCDSLCRFTLLGFDSLQVLSDRHCRPFSAERAGINIGEGAAYLLLERRPAERPGTPRGWLLGVGETSDAYHMTSPHPDGAGAIAAMNEALADAGIEPSAVDHVSAHATATRSNDIVEARAIAEVLGTDVPVVATKGYTGHQLGVCGATEIIFSLMWLEHGFLPPSLGCEPLDDDVGIHVQRNVAEHDGRIGLSNSFAFGGNNMSVVLGAGNAFSSSGAREEASDG